MKATVKKLFSAITDYAIAVIAVISTVFFTMDSNFFKDIYSLLCGFVVYPVIVVVVFYLFKIYVTLWKYSAPIDYLRLIFATAVSSFIFYVIKRSFQDSFKTPFELQDIVDIFFLTAALVFIVRVIEKISSKSLGNNKKNKQEQLFEGKIMLIGAGSAGQVFINDIHANKKGRAYKVKCVVDDDPIKLGQYICGVKVAGKTSDIVTLAKEYRIDTIVFAIPSCTAEEKSRILKICQLTDCKVRTMPSLYQMLSDDSININNIRKIEIEDLLGRDPININVETVIGYVENKTVLVTGGGGSIGSELCRQIAAHNPKRLIIFDIYENNAYDIQNELIRNYPQLDLIVRIGSVRDINRLESIFEQFKPQIVYHAAAHKHVPLMEDSPNESIKNNVFGTLNTVRCADKFGVNRFVLISTDKAVNPTNIMGASKRICEMIVQTYNNHSDTEFVAVRFGNVLGSNGSVIPLFKKQIEEGGPVTVTDPNIIRYFMTIPEAVSLVLQAGASAKGGEIFVLDMGEPVKILDLAENLIKLSGFKPYVDIKIDFTGLRPGEKLYEEKLLSEEGLTRTNNRLIHIGKPLEFDEEFFIKTLNEMQVIMSDDTCNIRSYVKKIVPTYTYNSATDTASTKA